MIVSRSLASPFNITGRTLEGRAVPFHVPARVTDDAGASYYWEQLLPGSPTKSIRDRAGGAFDLIVWHGNTSNRGHMPAEPIGEVHFTEAKDGLDYVAVVERSRLGDEMLEMAAEGIATDNSISYKPIADIPGEHNGEALVSRATIALRDLSLCPTGTAQHPGSKVLVMRSVDAVKSDLSLKARLRLLNL